MFLAIDASRPPGGHEHRRCETDSGGGEQHDGSIRRKEEYVDPEVHYVRIVAGCA